MEREDNVGPVELEDGEEKRGLGPLIKVGVVFCVLGVVIGLLLFSTSEKSVFTYSHVVTEVMRKPADFKDRQLRVEGDLKQGSILFKESPCEWRFVIGKPGEEMAVRFPQCIVPDTFKDGMGLKVTVQGHLTDQGYFLANQVIPRCPSKYDMQQMQQGGAKMPHPLGEKMLNPLDAKLTRPAS